MKPKINVSDLISKQTCKTWSCSVLLKSHFFINVSLFIKLKKKRKEIKKSKEEETKM